MATTPETLLQRSIQKWLRSKGYWCLKVHGSQYQRAGIPDLLILKNGKAWFIETKIKSNQPSPLQRAVIAEIERVADVPCFVIRSLEECALSFAEPLELEDLSLIHI